MDAYSRVYKAPKSPLAPLEPFSSQVFSFDSNSLSQNGGHQNGAPNQKFAKNNIVSPRKTTSSRNTCPSSNLSITTVKSKFEVPDITVTENARIKAKTVMPNKPASSLTNGTQSYQSKNPSKVGSTIVTPMARSLPIPIRAQTNSNSAGSSKNSINTPSGGASNGDVISYKSITKCVKYDGKNYTKYCVKKSMEESNNKKITTTKMYKVCSPIPPKKLCPKMQRTLIDIGQTDYSKLFEDEEIDYDTFQHFTASDLIEIGITSRSDRDNFLKAIPNIYRS